MALLSVQNVSKTFKDHDYRVHAVRNASLEVHRGEMIAIIGPSGSGKTTLLNLMGIVVAPDSGEVYVDGQKASDMSDTVRCRVRNQYFGYIVQDFALIEEDTSLQNILVPTLYSKHKKSSKEYREIINGMAEKLQIADKLKSTVKHLSGGERQRVAIIRSMINDQKIILADEPTGALDSKSTDELLGVFERINQSGQTILMVTHSVKAASKAGRVLFIKDGEVFHQVYKGEQTDEQFYQNISATLTMLATVAERQ